MQADFDLTRRIVVKMRRELGMDTQHASFTPRNAVAPQTVATSQAAGTNIHPDFINHMMKEMDELKLWKRQNMKEMDELRLWKRKMMYWVISVDRNIQGNLLPGEEETTPKEAEAAMGDLLPDNERQAIIWEQDERERVKKERVGGGWVKRESIEGDVHMDV